MGYGSMPQSLVYRTKNRKNSFFLSRVMRNLLNIGFPLLNQEVGSISDNVIKEMVKSSKKDLHILKAYMVVHITTKFRNISYFRPNKQNQVQKSTHNRVKHVSCVIAFFIKEKKVNKVVIHQIKRFINVSHICNLGNTMTLRVAVITKHPLQLNAIIYFGIFCCY